MPRQGVALLQSSCIQEEQSNADPGGDEAEAEGDHHQHAEAGAADVDGAK